MATILPETAEIDKSTILSPPSLKPKETLDLGGGGLTEKTWQDELAARCRKRGYPSPVYNIISDRRGGRTAWSCTVKVEPKTFSAKYWYDGQYVNNAKEDAASVACGGA